MRRDRETNRLAQRPDNRIRSGMKTNFDSLQFQMCVRFGMYEMFEQNCVASSSSESAAPNKPALDIVCELTWSQRDYLIYALNRYSQLLLGKALTGDAKNEIVEFNLELLSVLLSLPLQRSDGSGELQRPDDRGELASSDANEIVLDLHWRTRGRLIDSLATNHSLAVLHGHSIAGDAKLQLVEQNNELVNILLKLPARPLRNAIDANTAIAADSTVGAIGANGAIDQTEKPSSTRFERQCKRLSVSDLNQLTSKSLSFSNEPTTIIGRLRQQPTGEEKRNG